MSLTRLRVIDTPEKDVVLAVFMDEDGLLRNIRVKDPALKAAIQPPPTIVAEKASAAVEATPAAAAAIGDVPTEAPSAALPPPPDPALLAAHDEIFTVAERSVSNEEAERIAVAEADARAQAAWDAGAPARAALAAQQADAARKAFDEALTAQVTSIVKAIVPAAMQPGTIIQ